MGWFIADLKTGNVLIRSLTVKKGSVSPSLNKAGAITATVQLPLIADFGGVSTTIDASVIVEGKTVLGLEENGVILDAGPIWETSFNFDSWELDLTAAGIRSYFDHRFVLPANVSTHLGSDSSFSGLSLGTIAKRVLQQAQAWTNGSLPLVFEADVTGSSVRTYLGADLQRVSEVLTKLSEVSGGPDIDFRPVFTADRSQIQWNVVTGSPELKQAGADWVFDMSVPVSPVRAASKRRSASVFVTRDWETGGTPDGAQLPIVATAVGTVLTAAGYPVFESASNRSSVTTQSVLQGHADAAVAVGSKALEQFDFSVSRFPSVVLPDGREVHAGPWLGEYRVGDYAVLGLPGNPWTGSAPTRQRVRLLGFSYEFGSETVKFTTAGSRASV